MSVKHVKKPTIKGLAQNVGFGFGVPREYANYWLIKYTDKEDILWSLKVNDNPDLVLFVFMNRDRIISDLYQEVK